MLVLAVAVVDDGRLGAIIGVIIAVILITHLKLTDGATSDFKIGLGSKYRRGKFILSKVNNDSGLWLYLYDGVNTVPIRCSAETYRPFEKLLSEMKNVDIIVDAKIDTSDFTLVRIYKTSTRQKTNIGGR